MLCYYSAKGGSGCSVISAATALLLCESAPTLLVDFNGDLPAILGTESNGPGLVDWFRADEPPADALGRLEVDLGGGLFLLPTGECQPSGTSEQFRLLASLLRSERRQVVVDIGTSGLGTVALLNASNRSTLVTRACYLALRRAQCGPPPDDVVLVKEPGRALRASDVSAALQAPISATVSWDPSVARCVDAGLLQSRLPRSLKQLCLSL